MRSAITLIFWLVSFSYSLTPLKVSASAIFFDGLDAFVQKKLSAKGYQAALYYSPSLRFSDTERLINLRFQGNFRQWNPRYPVHPQAMTLTLEEGGINFCPNDAISALSQVLFPSPGRLCCSLIKQSLIR